jgi:hypothetical protein
MPSLGLTGAAIPGTKYGLRRLVNGLARDLFLENSAAYYQDLLGYAQPELETLDSAAMWLNRFVSDVLSPKKLIDQFDPARLAKPPRGKSESRSSAVKSAAETSPARGRTKRAVARSTPKPANTKAKRGRAK